VCDGQLVAAVEEERFNRVKYARDFPQRRFAIVKEGGIDAFSDWITSLCPAIPMRGWERSCFNHCDAFLRRER